MKAFDQRGMRAVYMRVAVGVVCTLLLVLNVATLGVASWREVFVAFVVGLLSGYYFTSAWYEARLTQSKRKRRDDA